MAEQKVAPNLLTFNAVLKALRRCGALGKSQAFPVMSEMKALSIGLLGDQDVFEWRVLHYCAVNNPLLSLVSDPSLASYNHVLSIFYKTGLPITFLSILKLNVHGNVIHFPSCFALQAPRFRAKKTSYRK